jgi:hypothetical protein
LPAEPATPFPFSTVTLTVLGGGAAVRSLRPSAEAFATFGASTSGCSNELTAFWSSSSEASTSNVESCPRFSIFDWKK